MVMESRSLAKHGSDGNPAGKVYGPRRALWPRGCYYPSSSLSYPCTLQLNVVISPEFHWQMPSREIGPYSSVELWITFVVHPGIVLREKFGSVRTGLRKNQCSYKLLKP